MTTYNTGNPIGSTDSRDRLDNTENMDYLENSTTELTHPDRLGTVRKTRHGMEVEHDAQIAAHESEHDAQIAAHESEHDAQIAAHESEHDAQMQSFEDDFDGRLAGMAFTRVGSFTTGATLTDMRQVLVWEVSQGGDGHEYGWAGTFTKVVAAGATPATSGGIGTSAWVDRSDVVLRDEITPSVTEALRRSYAEAGYNLVAGSFEAGGTLVNANDALLQERTGKAFSGPAGTVAAGTDPASGGFVDRSGALLASKLRTNLAYFMAIPNVASEANTAALEAAFNSGVPLYGTGKYIATRPILLSKKFNFDSMAGVGGAKFYVNGDFEFFKIDETAAFKTSGSYLRGFEFGSDVDGSGYGVKSYQWAAIWTVSDGIFQGTLRTGWDCPIILTRFDNVVFTDNGEYPCAIFDGSKVPPPPLPQGNRIQNANQFNWVRFRSRVNRLSNADHSIIFRLGMQNVWSNCEFAVPGGQVGTIEVGSAQLMRFLPGCWVEGPRSPYFIDCTTVGGFRPTQITFEGVHFAPKAGMNSWVGVLFEDTGDYDTAVSFVNCDEEATGVTSVQLTQNKQTLEYNTTRSLPSLDMNWFFYTKTPIGGLTPIPLTRGFYRDILTSRQLNVRGPGRYPLISLAGATSERFLVVADTTTSIVTIRSENNAATTSLNYQMDATAHYPGNDNTNASGKPGKRWSAVYAGTGAISTSDARMKTPVRKLSDAEVNVGLEIADEIGLYKWFSAVEEKGDAARLHSGVTVQRVIEVFEKHGLDPFEYGAVCYDKWDEYTETVPETLDENGNVLTEEYTLHHPAGDIYSLRNDEIHYLIMGAIREQQRRIEERISRLEQLT